MKTIIQLPYYPGEIYNSKPVVQLDNIKKILSKAEDAGFETGVQIFPGAAHPSLPYFTENMNTVLNTIKYIIDEKLWSNSTFHVPICPKIPQEGLNLGKKESINFHRNLLNSIKNTKIKDLILHPNTIYYVSKYSKNNLEEAANFTSNAIMLAKELPHFNFAYENMPFPVMSDFSANPIEVNIEPNLTTLESINKFSSAIESQKNISLCFDTSHYLITKNSIEYFREHEELLSNKNIQILVSSLSHNISNKEDAKKILDAISLPNLSKITNSQINEIQIGDTGRSWIPAINQTGYIIEEGLPLEKGVRNFDEIIGFIRENIKKQDIKLSFDIEETDYISRPNQTKSLDTFLEII